MKNQCERSVDLTQGRRVHVPNSRWYSKTVRERLRIPRTHSKAEANRKEKTNRKSPNRQTQKKNAEARRDFWSIHVNSTPHTSHFLVFHITVTLTLAQEQGVWRALHTCVIFMRSCCVLLDSLRLSLLLFAFHLLSHLPFSFSCSSPSSSMWGTRTLRTLANEDLGTLAEHDPLTGYEPNDLHISETNDIFVEESSGDSRSLNLCKSVQ